MLVDSKLVARIGAAVFVGFAIAMTLAQLREEPARQPDLPYAAPGPDGDPLSAQLRDCAQMGEAALTSPACRSAWAEKRRRFFGVDHPDAYSGLGDATSPSVSDQSNSAPAGQQRGED